MTFTLSNCLGDHNFRSHLGLSEPILGRGCDEAFFNAKRDFR